MPGFCLGRVEGNSLLAEELFFIVFFWVVSEMSEIYYFQDHKQIKEEGR